MSTTRALRFLEVNIQEIDLWSGIGYTYEKFSITTTYQAWIYGGSTENILDVSLGYDCLLQPTLMFHNRLTIGASGGANGTVMVLGLSHTVDAGPVSVTFPVNFATFLGENFYGGNAGSDSGYGYTSLGAQAAYPLAFLGDTYGEWSLDAGLNYYWTNSSVIPGNPSNHFLTYNFGLSASF